MQSAICVSEVEEKCPIGICGRRIPDKDGGIGKNSRKTQEYIYACYYQR
jgi:hypothetical protein